MRLLRAFAQGMKPGPEPLVAGLLFWVASFLPSWLASGPFRTGFHAALDRSPAAAELAGGGGMDLLAELGMSQPGLWGAGFGSVMAGAIAAALLAFFAASGTYARAASPEGSPWTGFWGQALRFLVPSGVVLLLNGILWGVVALVPFLVIVGLGQAWKGATDPAVDVHLFIAGAVCAAVVWGLFRAGAGFGRAWAARRGRAVSPAKAFLRGLAFSLRHLPQSQALTWAYGLARVAVLFLALGVMAPGFKTGGAVAGSLVLAQLGYFLAGYLKAAEVRSQVAYLGELPPEPAREVPLPAGPTAPEGEAAPADLTPEAAIEG